MIIKQGETDSNNSSKIKYCNRKKPGQHDQQIAGKAVQQKRNLGEYKIPVVYVRRLATFK